MGGPTKQKAIRVSIDTKKKVDALSALFNQSGSRVLDLAVTSLMNQIEKDGGALIIRADKGNVIMHPLSNAQHATEPFTMKAVRTDLLVAESRPGYGKKQKK